MRLFTTLFALVALFAAPVTCQDDKPSGEQFQFQADVNKLMVCCLPPPPHALARRTRCEGSAVGVHA